MRSFSKKLAFALAAAMVLTTAAPAAQAKAADEMTMNKSSKILYLNEGLNHKGAETLPEGLNGNVSSYDFSVKNKPENWKADYDFTWASSDKSVATVKAGGLTTAVGVGKATISCVVTEKATDKVIATAKTEVTVKANAAAVALLNPEIDGSVVEVGQTVDLNRVMYDEDGNETTKRGTYVTDYTRWIAEFDGKAAEGVTITQKNGKFTFEEGAPAGDYTLYCETYQSKKYDQTTATSEKIVVTLADSTFDVAQKTVKTFDIKFDAAVKTIGDVEVFRLVKAGDQVYEYPMVVKSAKLADDKMSVAVELFSALQDKVDYAVRLTGYDEFILTASAGAPATMTISASADSVSPFVTAGTEATLQYKLYDAKGVDVTDIATGSVLFNAKEYSTDGSYYVAGDKIWFVKSGLSTVVVAEYQSGVFVDGVQVGNVPAELEFFSVDKAPVTLKGVTAATVTGWDKPSLSFPKGDAATLSVKVALSEGDPVTITSNGQEIPNIGKITFETVTPEVAALDLATMKVVAFNQGTATIIVNLETLDANSQPVKTPIGVAYVTVQAGRALSNVTVDQALVTVADSSFYDKTTLKLTAKDQYGSDVALAAGDVAFDGANDAAKGVLGGLAFNAATKEIEINGAALAAALGENVNAIQLTFTAKVKNDKTVNFAVLVKKAVSDDKTNYISIETSGNFGEVARTADSKDAKAATFSVFKMNNGVKVGVQNVSKYPSTNSEAVEGQYYFKVTKSGTDVTSNVAVSGNAVTINFSEDDTTKTVSGSSLKVITYKMGAGNYVFTLYKAIKSGENMVLVQQQSATGVATCNPGAYSNAVRVSETVADANSDKAIRDCFSVKDTKGNEAGTAYFVVTKDNSASDYVYVDSITFYEDMGGAYAEYTVKVGVSLKK